MEWWQLMEHRALGYYVLVAGGAGTKRAVDNIVVAGPFVRMANAQAAAAEIERSVSSDEQTMPSD